MMTSHYDYELDENEKTLVEKNYEFSRFKKYQYDHNVIHALRKMSKEDLDYLLALESTS